MQNLDFCNEVLVMSNTGEASLDFAERRNKAMQQAKNEWLLYVDTDEIITKELEDEIHATISNPEYSSYFIKRQDEFWGKPIQYGEVLHARTKGIIRLVKKGSGTWRGRVHERFEPNKKSGLLKNTLLHIPHESIARFLEKINYYSTLRADELFITGKRTNAFEIIAYPVGKFMYSFVFLRGWKDGVRGFVYSFMMSFHSFLVRSKLYLLQSES